MPQPSAHAAETERLTRDVLSCLRRSGGTGPARLMLAGDLELATADSAHEAIRRAQDETREVICDLGDVGFVDLAGVQVLLSAAVHAGRTGGRFTVTNCPPIVLRMLRLLKLDHALEIQAAQRSARSPGCAELRRHVSRRHVS